MLFGTEICCLFTCFTNCTNVLISVDLSEMIDLNYTAAICETKQTLNAWKSRYHTPIGKYQF